MSSAYVQRILDRTSEANSGLWGSLVTANSILVAVGSTPAAVTPQAPILVWCLLVVVCAASLMLLILNFKATRDLYQRIGEQLSGTREPRDDDAATAEQQHRAVRKRERVALVLLFSELGIVLVGMLWDRLWPR